MTERWRKSNFGKIEMAEFKKTLTEQEIATGTLNWKRSQDELLRKVVPQTFVFDLIFEGKRLDHLAVEWEKRELYIGEVLMQASPGAELILTSTEKSGTTIQAKVVAPPEKMIVRKRLSLNEFKHRQLKWYVREEEIYRRLIPQTSPFSIEINGTVTPNRQVDFEKRTLMVGEPLRVFNPGDLLLIHRSPNSEIPTLVITKEQLPSNVATDAMASLRALITRLLSRSLSEFNEGEIKGLIALLDENKNLWEKLMTLSEENEKLKEQVATLENVFDQFVRNTFFTSKKDFQEWVVSHIGIIEKGIRVLHRDYVYVGEDEKKGRMELLCQDRKGVLVAVEIVFNPTVESLAAQLKSLTWVRENPRKLGRELTNDRLEANQLRVMVVSNREKPSLVELCLQTGVKLCVINCGMVVDVIE